MAGETVTVRLFFPSRPETHAYVIPEHGRFYYGRPRGGEIDGVVVILKDVPTWSYAEIWVWYREVGARITHMDGTPWTNEDWNKRHYDAAAVDKRIWPRRLSGI